MCDTYVEEKQKEFNNKFEILCKKCARYNTSIIRHEIEPSDFSNADVCRVYLKCECCSNEIELT